MSPVTWLRSNVVVGCVKFGVVVVMMLEDENNFMSGRK